MPVYRNAPTEHISYSEVATLILICVFVCSFDGFGIELLNIFCLISSVYKDYLSYATTSWISLAYSMHEWEKIPLGSKVITKNYTMKRYCSEICSLSLKSELKKSYCIKVSFLGHFSLKKYQYISLGIMWENDISLWEIIWDIWEKNIEMSPYLASE